MKEGELSKSEKAVFEQLIKKTKTKLDKYKIMITIISLGAFIIISYLTYSYWVDQNISHLTSIIIGGQLYTVFGAALTMKGALSRPSTIALMSMTRVGSNSILFGELMKSRIAAIIGISFIGFGFLIQALAMIINEIIEL